MGDFKPFHLLWNLECEEIFLNFAQNFIDNESRQIQSNKGCLGRARSNPDLASQKVELNFSAGKFLLF